MEFEITVDGLDDIAAELNARLADILPAAAIGVGKVAKDVEKDARKLAAVDTGEMREKIQAQPPVIKGDAVEADVVAGARHSLYVEYGTGIRGADSSLPEGMPPATYRPDWNGQTAQPFMYPAMKQNEQKAKATIADEIRKAVEK